MTVGPQAVTAVPAGTVIATVTGDALLARLDNLANQQGKIEAHVAGISPAMTVMQQQLDISRADIVALKQRAAFLAGIGSVVTLLLTSGVVVAVISALHR